MKPRHQQKVRTYHNAKYGDGGPCAIRGVGVQTGFVCGSGIGRHFGRNKPAIGCDAAGVRGCFRVQNQAVVYTFVRNHADHQAWGINVASASKCNDKARFVAKSKFAVPDHVPPLNDHMQAIHGGVAKCANVAIDVDVEAGKRYFTISLDFGPGRPLSGQHDKGPDKHGSARPGGDPVAKATAHLCQCHDGPYFAFNRGKVSRGCHIAVHVITITCLPSSTKNPNI